MIDHSQTGNTCKVSELEQELALLKAEKQQLDHALADHKHSLAVARRRLYGPSFLKELESYKEYVECTSAEARFASLPTRGMTYKLRAYEQVASHGFETPEIYDVWSSPKAVDFAALPDSFVLKSDGGSTSNGVLPLVRKTRDSFTLADGKETLTVEDVRSHFSRAYASGAAYGVMFAEELLQPSDRSERIPDDVKVYAAYGRIMQVLLRRVDAHGTLSETRSKYVDSSGVDLGPVASHRQIDPTIPAPATLPKMIEISKHLSRASGLPFCRVDLYDTTKGVVVGEITRAPGGAQTYDAEHDQWMGQIWHLANADLLLDYQRGRPAGLLWGNHPIPNYYGDPSRSPYSWKSRIVVSCSEWCTENN